MSGADSATTEVLPPATPVTRPKTAAAENGSVRRSLAGAGEIVVFCGQVIRSVPAAVRLYPSEIIRIAGMYVRSNLLVVLSMTLMIGALIGLTLHFLFGNIGIESYVGGAHAIGGMRGATETAFGWMFAAKLGCGIVAELGSMRISEEVDALEVMGIRPIPYLAGTRFVAALLVVPLLWISALFFEFIGGYLLNVLVLGTTSPGAYIYFLFLFQNGYDFTVTLIWGTLIGLLIVLVSSYYGLTAKGGPVGVGDNTARSMMVSIVIISITAMMLEQLFWGSTPNSPIGN
ncbi:MlaE family ABC transporter permease [Amycolatopsis methanolica]|uniref:ABC transporter permease n=1 Tax=Amycolatopsis methanolica 239 TaxID=1068978 RepID=A0A076MR06_AMYME|nr:ABC transporter permease [Amycolatopsis methanolica]AIJ21300.1 hypothetical protein AMETH_1208 [Amycolatopsis methanolica 239]